MIKTKFLFLIMLVLILLAPALSNEVNSAWLEWRGERIEVVGERPQPPLIVNLRFMISEIENVSLIKVDARELNIDIRSQNDFGYASLEVLPRDCSSREQGFECLIRGIRVYTNESNPSLQFEVIKQGGEISSSSTQLQLTIDNSKPEVVSIGKENCEQNCMVAPNIAQKIIIKTQGSNTGFERNNNIFFRVGTRYSAVSSCEDGTCEGFITPSCTSGQMVNLQITANQGDPNQPSRDDAGIRLEGIREQGFICDGIAPQIKNVTVLNEAGSEIVTSADNLFVRFEIEDRIASRLQIRGLLDSIGIDEPVESTCTDKVDDVFICSVALQPITSSGSYTIPFSIIDNAGNLASTQVELNIRGIDERETNFWQVSDVSLSLNSLNKRNLAFSREVFAEVELRANNPQITINTISLGESCSPSEESSNYGSQGDIFSHRLVENADGGFISRFSIREYGNNIALDNRYEEINELRFNCPITITSKSPQRVYSYEETYNYTVRITLRDEPGLSTSIKKEIERVEKQFQDFEDGTWGKIKTVMDTVSAGCTGSQIMTGIFATMGITFSIEESLSQLMQPATIMTQEQRIERQRFVQEQKEAYEKTTKPLEEMCQYLTCQKDPLELISGGAADWRDQALNLGGVLDNKLVQKVDTTLRGSKPMGSFATDDKSNTKTLEGEDREERPDILASVLNPYKSPLIAWGTMCVPAILHHKEERLAIQCTYADCLHTGVGQFGMSVSDCRYQRDFSECLRTTSNLLDTFPVSALLREYSSIVQQAVSDPVLLFGTGGVALYCKYLAGNVFGYGPCITINNFAKMAEQITRLANMIRNISTQFNTVFGDRRSVCQGIFSNINYRNDYYEFIRRGSIEDVPRGDFSDPFVESQRFWDGTNPESVVTCYLDRCIHEGTGFTYIIPPATISVTSNEPQNPTVGDVLVYNGNSFIGQFRNTVRDPTPTPPPPSDTDGGTTPTPPTRDIDFNMLIGGGSTNNDDGSSEAAQAAPTTFFRVDPNAFDEKGNFIQRHMSKEQANKLADVVQAGNPFNFPRNYWGYSDTGNDNLNAEINRYEGKLHTNTIDINNAIKNENQEEVNRLINERREIMKNGARDISRKIQEAEINYSYSNHPWQSFFGLSRAMSGFKNLMGIDNFGDWRAKGYGAFGRFMAGGVEAIDKYVTRAEIAICELRRTRSIASENKGNLNFRTNTHAQLGSYLQAQKILTQHPTDGTQEYTYFISGGIRAKESDLGFKLILKDQRGIVRDITPEVYARSHLNTIQNQIVPLSTDGILQYKSNREYTQVCIEFLSAYHRYFDVDRGTPNSNTMCQKIVVE